MKILVTGGSGFLGSALVRHLHRSGYAVALLLRPTSNLSRLEDLEGQLRIGRCQSDEEIQAFVLDIAPDAVIHTACLYGRRGEGTLQVFDANLRFGLLLLQAVSTLSTAVTFINTGTVLAPDIGAYALSKTQFSHWGQLAVNEAQGRLRFINVLLQHMYGPGDDPSKFTTHVLQACLRNDATLSLTAGEQRRDFIYIDDVVDAYTALLLHAEKIEPYCDVNVGSGDAPTIREFVEAVHSLTASRTELLFGAVPYRANEAMHCQADLGKMMQLGWRPTYSLESGLEKMISAEKSRLSA